LNQQKVIISNGSIELLFSRLIFLIFQSRNWIHSWSGRPSVQCNASWITWTTVSISQKQLMFY